MSDVFVHRRIGYSLLTGHGLEIGALNHPAEVPAGSSVEYMDVASGSELRTRFPEIPPLAIVEPRWVGDVCERSVPDITGRCYDFIILNHVIEHVANPIAVLDYVLQGVREGGLLVIAVPDKRFMFDQERSVTSFSHLLADYYLETRSVSDDHYVDFLEHVHPESLACAASFKVAISAVRERREHVHVWDSPAFRAFLVRAFGVVGREAHVLFESQGVDNHVEYFGVVQAGSTAASQRAVALKVLLALYGLRKDLQDAFPASSPNYMTHLLHWTLAFGVRSDAAAAILAPYVPAYHALAAGHRRSGRAARRGKGLASGGRSR